MFTSKIGKCLHAHQQSETQVRGWHAVNQVCQAAEVLYPDRITAIRHRVNTLYAGIEMSNSDRQLFYKHMGNSGAINENVYQTHEAEAEILKVGSNMTVMDGQNIHCHSITKQLLQ